MKIEVKKFGEILISRPAGREAALAIQSYLKPGAKEKIELDFTDVLSVGPSWLDEVLRSLREKYGAARVICLPTENISVIESLKVIAEGERS